jgi:hypothetical protein
MRRRPETTQIFPETTGLRAAIAPLDRGIGMRPLSLAWIADDLLQRTQEVWSKAYGRPVSEDEAIEMLLNVKRLAEVMLKSDGQTGGVRE